MKLNRKRPHVWLHVDTSGIVQWGADWRGADDYDCKRMSEALLRIRRDILRTLKTGGQVREVTGSQRRA